MQALIFMDLHTLGFFYIHCILEMCYKNTLAQGWGLCKAKEYLSIGMGWGGFKNGRLGANILYGWSQST